jgi:hypothetical protein
MKKTQFGFSTEMQYGNQGTTSAQLYTDTLITLSAPDPRFGKGAQKRGANASVVTGITSEEGSQGWKIASVEVPAMRLGAENHPATGTEIRAAGKSS